MFKVKQILSLILLLVVSISSLESILHEKMLNSTQHLSINFKNASRYSLVNSNQQHHPHSHHNHNRYHHNSPENPEIPKTWKRNASAIDEAATRKHICTEKKVVHVPIKSKEIYRKPAMRHFSEPCHDQKICTGVRLVHETAYRDVIRHRATKQIAHVCCPGWDTLTTVNDGCHKPICRTPCRNGGVCVKPEVCNCVSGFTGRYCEKDVNECKEDKPCDQTCYNTEGSYYCTCREGFILHTDRQSCKKIGSSNGVAFEARDLELDDDYDNLNSRLTKLEKIILSDDKRSLSAAYDLNKKVQYALDSVASLKTQLNRIEHQQHEIISHRDDSSNNNVKSMNPITDIMYKCRTKSNVYCP